MNQSCSELIQSAIIATTVSSESNLVLYIMVMSAINAFVLVFTYKYLSK